MQKKIIALALAALAGGSAFAQSNVAIYGRVDYGYLNRGGDISRAGTTTLNRDNKSEFASGIAGGSRIGFKGAEDLGNGLKAIFELEYNLGVDTNAGIASARHQYVGLTGGFGTVVGGYLDGVRYGIFNKYDAFAGGTVGNFTQMTAQVDRANNAIAYISPNFSGVTLTLAAATHIGSNNPLGLGAQEGSAAPTGKGNDGDARLTTAMLNYANGPLDLTADWERVSFASGGTGTAALVDDVTVYTLAGSYDFGVVKVRALFDNLKADLRAGGTLNDVNSWLVSATAPLGANAVLKATYGQTKDKEISESKAKKYAIGVDYNLSKRTYVYADFGKIAGPNSTGIGISQAANGMNSAANLYGERGFDLGIAHKF